MALPQPLHIFRKDLTHLWPETLFVLGLFALFAYTAPSAWDGSEYIALITIASFLIKVLMVISWLVLIARAIQDESLVGDRQFWTSRPYHWGSLFAAKILLIVTIIYIPFFLMQCYILHHAGLHPTLVLPDLLHNLLLLTVVVIIPLAALSAVTSTFPRVLLTFIATAIAILILFAILFFNRFLQMQTPHLDWIIDTIFIVLPIVALLFQYKTRKTLISRLILAATPVLAVLVVLLAPDAAIINRAYPVASGPKLSSLTDTMPPPNAPTGELLPVRNYISISLPVGVTGIDKTTDFIVQGIRATVTGPGVDYRSSYMSPIPLHDDQFGGDRPMTVTSFLIPRKIFDKIRNQPVDIHLQFATEQLKAQNPSTWHATAAPFSVPGNGICSFPDENAPPNPMLRSGHNPVCRYPLKQPEFNFVSATLAARSCSSPAAPPVTGQANVGGPASPIPDFDPVITIPLRFETGDPQPIHTYVLCPGTALTFVGAQTLPNATLVVDQKNLILDPFAERYTPRASIPPPAPPNPSPEPN